MGKFSFDVIFESTDAKSQAHWEKRLPIKGEIVCDVQTRPAAAVFGAASVGETLQERITVYSITGRRISFEAARSSASEGVTFEALPEQGAQLAFLIKQRVVNLGQQTGHVLINVQDENGVKSNASLDVSYFGIREANK